MNLHMALCIASTKTVNQIQNALTYPHVGYVPQFRYTTRLGKHGAYIKIQKD